MGLYDRTVRSIKDFAGRYGKLGLAVYLSVSAVSLTSCYLAVRAGLDTKSLMRRVGFELSDEQERFGTVLGAYAVHKVLLPVRLSATVFLTGVITRMRQKPKL